MYWFIGPEDRVLYVGKAKNLKNRLSTYKQYKRLLKRTQLMVGEALEVKHQVLESELEALLIEAELIRTHQPPYNILLKDDKTPLYILITAEKFPRVLTIRKKEIQKNPIKGTLLGPFPSAYKVKEVLNIARRTFPWCADPEGGRPCFYYHLQLCPGACIGKISAEDYNQIMKNLVLFLRGKKKEVIKNLNQEMKTAVADQHFEQAARLRDSWQAVKAVTEQHFPMKPNPILPALKLNQAEESVIQLRQLLATYLELPKDYPLTRIEGYDVSNIQGTNAAVAMVTFINGEPDTDEYRLFNIKTIAQANDYGMLQEALQRRQNHPEWGEPDLVVIDGGKGQLRAALSVWHSSTPIISIAKKPDRIIIPASFNYLTRANPEMKKFQPKYYELQLGSDHLALRLVQRIRDESHRFSKKQHTRRRTKMMFK